MVESMNTLAKISCADVDIRSRILTFRGVQVMLDRDLAELYGVDVKRLNQQVNRNLDRFPERFMHQLTMQEFADLKLQIATSSSVGDGRSDLKLQIATSSWGGVRKPPKVFTEQGISMLSAVLHTQTAVQVSIRIGRKWTRDETILALGLYFQIPFAKISSRNQEIRKLAQLMKRSPASLSMKMDNLG